MHSLDPLRPRLDLRGRSLAQALVTNTAPLSLEVADELSRRSTFFAPHAEGARMTYHAFRGETRKAAEHRARAEALAFRGATSWSATSVLTIRSVQACVMTGDIVGLMHVVADLEPQFVDRRPLARAGEGVCAAYGLGVGVGVGIHRRAALVVQPE